MEPSDRFYSLAWGMTPRAAPGLSRHTALRDFSYKSPETLGHGVGRSGWKFLNRGCKTSNRSALYSDAAAAGRLTE